MKNRPEEGELFHVDRGTERHDKNNGAFSQFCEKAAESQSVLTLLHYSAGKLYSSETCCDAAG